jgi:hypothetical protein
MKIVSLLRQSLLAFRNIPTVVVFFPVGSFSENQCRESVTPCVTSSHPGSDGAHVGVDVARVGVLI